MGICCCNHPYILYTMYEKYIVNMYIEMRIILRSKELVCSSAQYLLGMLTVYMGTLDYC